MRIFFFVSIARPAAALTLLCVMAGCGSQPPARPLAMTGRVQPASHVVTAADAPAARVTDTIKAVEALPVAQLQVRPVELTSGAADGHGAVGAKPGEILFQADSSSAASTGAAPPVVILKLDAPIVFRQESSAVDAGETRIPSVANGPLAAAGTPALSPKLQAALEKILNTVVHMDGITLFGLVAVVAMLVFYTFEERSHLCVLGFALACWMGSTYGFLQGAWPFGMVEGIWGFVALRNWWLKIKAPEALDEHPLPSTSPIQS